MVTISFLSRGEDERASIGRVTYFVCTLEMATLTKHSMSLGLNSFVYMGALRNLDSQYYC